MLGCADPGVGKVLRDGPEVRADGVVVDELSASAVDEHRIGGHEGQRLGVDHVVVVRRGAGVEGDDVAAAQQLLEGVDECDALARPVGGPRVVDEDVASEGGHDVGDSPSYGAVSDHSDGGGAHFGPHVVEDVVVGSPLAGQEFGVPLRDLPHGRQDHPHRVLGGGHGVASGRVGDENPVVARRLDVHVDGAPTADGDHLQVGARLDDLPREREGVGEGDVAPSEGRDELVLVAGGLPDFADVAVGGNRPGRGYGGQLRFGGCG